MTKRLGQQYEQLAEDYLKQHDLQLVSKNFLCRLGEIDLIMLDNDTLVFIEVRYRNNLLYGSPIESVTLSKQRKILKAAQYFIMKHPQYHQHNFRFDIVGISQQGQSVEWLSNAFGE